MATKKEWKEWIKACREWLKASTIWVKEQSENKAAGDEIGGPGTNPPPPPPPPPIP